MNLWASNPQARTGAEAGARNRSSSRLASVGRTMGIVAKFAVMDNVTHTFVALTLSQTRIGRIAPGATAALVVASNVPDVDIVAAFSGGQLGYLSAHRGITHGPLGVLGLAALVGAGVWAFERRWRASSA